jgi:endonuclease YncB( thermonuclease family)
VSAAIPAQLLRSAPAVSRTGGSARLEPFPARPAHRAGSARQCAGGQVRGSARPPSRQSARAWPDAACLAQHRKLHAETRRGPPDCRFNRLHPCRHNLTGKAGSVQDGDTLTLNGATVRLWGIDAPELAQPCTNALGRRYRCGLEAREKLKAIVGRQDLVRRERDRDRYGRIVASRGVRGEDVGRLRVRAGQAVDYRRHGGGRYARDQRRAKRSRAGIRAGTFTMPSGWGRER